MSSSPKSPFLSAEQAASEEMDGWGVYPFEVLNLALPEQRPKGVDFPVGEVVSEIWFGGKDDYFKKATSSSSGATSISIAVLMLLSVDDEIVVDVGSAMATASVGLKVEVETPVAGDVPQRFVSRIQLEESCCDVGSSPNAVFLKMLGSAVAQARMEMRMRIEIWDGDDESVMRWLSRDQPIGREEAIRVVGERKIKAALPLLLPFVVENGPHVHEAVGALGALRDPAALKSLSSLTASTDAQLLRVVLYAISDIGGTKADSYLQSIAAGHASPALRKLATELLERIEPVNNRSGTR